ncbi:MAG: hypothetical protein V1707_01255 [bacterium]
MKRLIIAYRGNRGVREPWWLSTGGEKWIDHLAVKLKPNVNSKSLAIITSSELPNCQAASRLGSHLDKYSFKMSSAVNGFDKQVWCLLLETLKQQEVDSVIVLSSNREIKRQSRYFYNELEGKKSVLIDSKCFMILF